MLAIMPVPLTNQRTHVCRFEVEEHVKHEKAVDCQVNARDGVVLQVCLRIDVPCTTGQCALHSKKTNFNCTAGS
jgi:hypothetical protein